MNHDQTILTLPLKINHKTLIAKGLTATFNRIKHTVFRLRNISFSAHKTCLKCPNMFHIQNNTLLQKNSISCERCARNIDEKKNIEKFPGDFNC